ncbi:hypothetical protein QOT17_017497 [Balamuthia mandrillaris]
MQETSPSAETLTALEGSEQKLVATLPLTSSDRPATLSTTLLLRRCVEIILRFGGTRVVLFGSAVWNERPGDLDLVVEGIETQDSFCKLFNHLKQEVRCEIDLLRGEHVSGTLEQVIQMFGMDVTNSQPSLPARSYTAAQFEAEINHMIVAEGLLRLLESETLDQDQFNACAFYKLFDWTRQKFGWEGGGVKHFEVLLALFGPMLKAPDRQLVSDLRQIRNRLYYKHPFPEWIVPPTYQQLRTTFISCQGSIINFVRQTDKWPPDVFKGVSQPLKESKQREAALREALEKKEKEFKQREASLMKQLEEYKKKIR